MIDSNAFRMPLSSTSYSLKVDQIVVRTIRILLLDDVLESRALLRENQEGTPTNLVAPLCIKEL